MELNQFDKKKTRAIILCGGKGTRLKSLTIKNPKPMILINGKPFLYYIINKISQLGINKFTLCIGYKSQKITNYFKDGSSLFGNINIKYSYGPVSWETGKRIYEAKKSIKDKNILICYSDNFIVNFSNNFIKKSKKFNLIFNLYKKTVGNFYLKKKSIINYSLVKRIEFPYVELGYIFLKRKLLDVIENKNVSLNEYFQKLLTITRTSNVVNNLYLSISDPKRLKNTRSYMSKRKIILLDRDGIINYRKSIGQYITKANEIKYIKNNLCLLKKLSDDNFRFIIISNQAGVGRGLIKVRDLKEINDKIIVDLKNIGIKILKIYFCPHHWIDNCKCRKPKPYMINQACKDYNLNKDKTLFIGDDYRDYLAAKSANCYYIHKNHLKITDKKKYLGNLKNKNTIFNKIINLYY
jgi:D-glycero-D-manno-heptose 1,7-bisphosphate phosphatase